METAPEMMLETTMEETELITNIEESELRTDNELMTTKIFDQTEWIETTEYFKTDNPVEIKYEFEEIPDDDYKKLLASF